MHSQLQVCTYKHMEKNTETYNGYLFHPAEKYYVCLLLKSPDFSIVPFFYTNLEKKLENNVLQWAHF